MEYKKYDYESMKRDFDREMLLSNIVSHIFTVAIFGCLALAFYFHSVEKQIRNAKVQIVKQPVAQKEEPKISPFADRKELFEKLSSATNMITDSERLISRKIKVMIIETEIDVKHPFLVNFFKPTLEKRQKYVFDHGNHVAGIIAMRLIEVFGQDASKYVEFVPCQYYGVDKDGQYIVSAYEKEVACLKQALREKVDIVNLSGGGTEFFEEEEKVIRQLEKAKVTVVVAAGNERGSSLNYFPCNVKANNIVCVGNVDQYGRKHVSSNDGPNVNYVAYGTNELSSLLKDGFGYMTGTSQATPQVTALLVAKKITLSEKVSNTIIAHGMIVKRELPKEINLNRSIASVKESK